VSDASSTPRNTSSSNAGASTHVDASSAAMPAGPPAAARVTSASLAAPCVTMQMRHDERKERVTQRLHACVWAWACARAPLRRGCRGGAQAL
jgi:hypothetical protein